MSWFGLIINEADEDLLAKMHEIDNWSFSPTQLIMTWATYRAFLVRAYRMDGGVCIIRRPSEAYWVQVKDGKKIWSR